MSQALRKQQNTRHQVKRYRALDGKEEVNPIKFNQLFSDTFHIQEEIKNAGYNLVTMWECQWDRTCKVYNLLTS